MSKKGTQVILELDNVNRNLLRYSKVERYDILNLDDKFPRPPKPTELTAENFSLPKHANNFYNGFCSGKKTRENSAKVPQLNTSFHQGLFYAVSQGKIKMQQFN